MDFNLDEKTRQILSKLCEQFTAGKAKLIEENGQIQVKYLDTSKQKYDSSQCGKVVSPKTNHKEVIESFLSVIDFIKEKRAPDGVVLDKTKIPSKGTYKAGKDYDVLNKVLGKGLNGDIVIARDRTLGSDHALKTMMLAHFNTNEIRCWTDLEGSDYFPSLYMFKKQDEKIEFHFEILNDAVTIRDIIENHMIEIREDKQLLRHFSLHILQGLLEASSLMHSKQWIHDDLHEENAMIQPKQNAEMQVRVIDFGRAKKMNEEKVIIKDIQEIIRVFTSVYVGQNFNSTMDLKDNWEEKLDEQAKMFQLSDSYKDELLSLVKLSLDVYSMEEETNLNNIVKAKLKDSKEKYPHIMEEISKLIFPEQLETDCVDGLKAECFTYKDILRIGCYI